jgi:5-methylcytosine-specific restriction endonuclease McrA
MMTDPTEVRPCERFCEKCRQWLHHSRFRQWRDTDRCHRFRPDCKACEQIERNKRKNLDRPLAIIQRRAAERATRLGVSKQFVWVNLNWRALVPLMRAMLSPEGRCLNCGHPFVNERDIQIDHIEPPRSLVDFARERAINLRLICQSCNGTKGAHLNAEWLDRQEDARQSNLREVGELEVLDGVVDRTAPLLPFFE